MFEWFIANLDYIMCGVAGVGIGLLGGYLKLVQVDNENESLINLLLEEHRAEVRKLEDKLGQWK